MWKTTLPTIIWHHSLIHLINTRSPRVPIASDTMRWQSSGTEPSSHPSIAPSWVAFSPSRFAPSSPWAPTPTSQQPHWQSPSSPMVRMARIAMEGTRLKMGRLRGGKRAQCRMSVIALCRLRLKLSGIWCWWDGGESDARWWGSVFFPCVAMRLFHQTSGIKSLFPFRFSSYLSCIFMNSPSITVLHSIQSSCWKYRRGGRSGHVLNHISVSRLSSFLNLR